MGQDAFELKPIHHESVGKSLEKARRYRLLNDPVQAESICLDILGLEPEHHEARTELVLALTDQFAGRRNSVGKAGVLEHVAKLPSEYERAYYTGIVCEREALSFLERGQAAVFAYDGLRDAMEWYEKAEAIRPSGNDDPLLRYNACVRTIERERLKPPPAQAREPAGD